MTNVEWRLERVESSQGGSFPPASIDFGRTHADYLRPSAGLLSRSMADTVTCSRIRVTDPVADFRADTLERIATRARWARSTPLGVELVSARPRDDRWLP